MKFSIAAAAIAATSSFVGVGVHASTSTSNSKSGKGSCSSSPKLEKFCNEEPANFEGTRKICYSNIIREAASGLQTGAYHVCPNGEGDSDVVFKPLDSYGAYESTLIIGGGFLGNLGGGSVSFSYQGIAQGNTIKMTSYGDGLKDGDGNTIRQNETPDTEECTIYDDGILKCIAQHNEYCGSSDDSQGPDIDCEVGTWLKTYTIETISALEGFDCPEPPVGFCESGDRPGPPSRKLQEEEEEENKVTPCPFFNKNMN